MSFEAVPTDKTVRCIQRIYCKCRCMAANSVDWGFNISYCCSVLPKARCCWWIRMLSTMLIGREAMYLRWLDFLVDFGRSMVFGIWGRALGHAVSLRVIFGLLIFNFVCGRNLALLTESGLSVSRVSLIVFCFSIGFVFLSFLFVGVFGCFCFSYTKERRWWVSAFCFVLFRGFLNLSVMFCIASVCCVS